MITTEDTLINRIAATEATRNEWHAFEQHAEDEPRAWERLARTLRDELSLRSALDESLAAGEVGIPERAIITTARTAPIEIETERDWQREDRRAASPTFEDQAIVASQHPRTLRWSGWAIAAMLAVAWVAASIFMPNRAQHPAQSDVSTAGLINPAMLSPDDAYDLYRDRGIAEQRLIEELPILMVGTQAVDNGEGVEVIYVRRLVERAKIDVVFELGVDDLGQPRGVPREPSMLLTTQWDRAQPAETEPAQDGDD